MFNSNDIIHHKKYDTLYIWVIFLLLLLTSCSSSGVTKTDITLVITPDSTNTPSPTEKPKVSCPDVEVQVYQDSLDTLLEEWDDAVKIADSTPRMSLATLIKDLQDIKRGARKIVRPECSNYLNDLVIVAMERKIDSFISFLSKDSDTVVARKMNGAQTARDVVEQEITKFKTDPMAAYLSSSITADILQQNLDKAIPFEIQEGWIDSSIANNPDLNISLPSNWEASTFGDNNQFNRYKSDDGKLELLLDVFDQSTYAEFDTDSARLFALKTTLESDDYDYYLEHSSNVGVYALNKGYLVEFSKRDSANDDIVKQIWTIVITPEGKELLVIANTTRDDFTEFDRFTLEEILGSIRKK